MYSVLNVNSESFVASELHRDEHFDAYPTSEEEDGIEEFEDEAKEQVDSQQAGLKTEAELHAEVWARAEGVRHDMHRMKVNTANLLEEAQIAARRNRLTKSNHLNAGLLEV